jgi:CRISPR-associated protein Csx10
MVSTLDYIPGSIMRGIFAKRYIEQEKLGSEAHKDDFFYDCFLNPGLCFTNAYLKDDTNHYPTPLSIQSVKGREDTIFDRIKKDDITDQTKYVGKYCKITDDTINFVRASKSINFHHARYDRLKGHSDEGIIFNYESLDPMQEFSGKITGNEKDLNIILDIFKSSVKIYIGRSKNTQYGQAELSFVSHEPETFASEIDSLNPEKISNPFILTFLSHAIIYNNNGFSSTSLWDIRSCLAKTLEVTPENIHIKKAFKRSETVENFVSKWLLKRPSEEAIKAGSCFEIFIDNLSEKIKQSLIELQKTGLGERTGEGFGHFAINLQKNGQYKLRDVKDKKTGKPDGSAPEITKDVIKNVAIKSYHTRAEVQALSDCQSFCKDTDRIPTSSLLGKLELMLKDSNNSGDFIIKINSLPESTKEKLKRCRNQNVNLIDFVRDSETNIVKILEPEHCLRECCDLIGYKPETDNAIKTDIYKFYWVTFLRSMRLAKKKGRD